ncbi:MAG: cupin domain-containing protein [Alphaproteobacteria bacterium]|nr:cupin domain-containing protein [Alphaproteobacteria bacterium]HJP22312.1 cupin domain-containing protein [Alphaproteobacteria bacterium]
MASGGRMRAEHIQCAGVIDGVTGWHCHDLEFQLVYVLRGRVAFTAEGWGDVVLEAGDCAHTPPFTMHDETEFSADFEVIEVTMPADVTTLTEKPEDRSGRPDSTMVVDYLGDDSFLRCEGPRAFLEYRDFGLGAATQGGVQAQVVRTNGPCDASTGWHYHEFDVQFVYVLKGWVKTELEGLGKFHMDAGDAMVVPSRHKHDVTAFSEDFEVFEINVPAEFETVSL